MEKIKTQMQNNGGQVILGVALVLAVVVGGVFYTTKTVGSHTLTVTGSAKMPVTADNVIWRSNISRNVGVGEIKEGYAQLAADLKAVQAFLSKNGIDEKSITISTVSLNQEYSQYASDPKRYSLMQNIEINSTDVEKVTDIAKHVDALVNQGIFFQSYGLEYYYSKLADARVSLLTDAITDARARAQAMARSSHQSVGKLQSASSGVVQVLSQGAVDNGDYGQYDTSKIEKEISVTVRATFTIR
jgi:hypothetical protein